ncbi:hypothetical protein ACFX2C_040796 [Malus domestica]
MTGQCDGDGDTVATFGKMRHNQRLHDEHMSRRNIPDLNEIAQEEDMIDKSLAIMPFVDSNVVITNQRELVNDLVDEQIIIDIGRAYKYGISYRYGTTRCTTLSAGQDRHKGTEDAEKGGERRQNGRLENDLNLERELPVRKRVEKIEPAAKERSVMMDSMSCSTAEADEHQTRQE